MIFNLIFNRLSEYTKAKKDYKEYYEKQLSERINAYAQSRRAAIAAAESIGITSFHTVLTSSIVTNLLT
jgi:hypothetical protein